MHQSVFLILTGVLSFLPEKIKENNNEIYLYSEIYFSDLKFKAAIYALQNITTVMKISIRKNDSVDDFINNVKTPYQVILHVLNIYKQQNTFKNIPDPMLKRLNDFLDMKITRDKNILNKVIPASVLKKFLTHLRKMFDNKELYNHLCIDTAQSKEIGQIYAERLANEFVGLLINNNEILDDFNNTSLYLNNCEKEFIEINK